MGRKRAAWPLALMLVTVLLDPGCATVLRKRTERIPVTSVPAGARVLVNGRFQGETPVEVRLERKRKGQVIRIEAPGYNPVEIRPERKRLVGPIVGNLLIGFGLGMFPAWGWGLSHDESSHYGSTIAAIWGLTTVGVAGLLTFLDSDGPGYTLEPRALVVTLTKADGTPRVETIVLDEKDMRNVTWIRVQAK